MGRDPIFDQMFLMMSHFNPISDQMFLMMSHFNLMHVPCVKFSGSANLNVV